MRKIVLLVALLALISTVTPAFGWTVIQFDPSSMETPFKKVEYMGSDDDPGRYNTKPPIDMETWNREDHQYMERYGPVTTVLVNVWGRVFYDYEEQYHPPRLRPICWWDGADSLVSYPRDDVRPYLDVNAGRVMVPVRFVSEKLGASVDYALENGQVHVWIVKEDRRVDLWTGRDKAQVNGQEIALDVPAQLAEWKGKERVVVPLRFVGEALGCYVYWMTVEPDGRPVTDRHIANIWMVPGKVIIDDPGAIEKAADYMKNFYGYWINKAKERNSTAKESEARLNANLEILEKARRGEKVYPIEPTFNYVQKKAPVISGAFNMKRAAVLALAAVFAGGLYYRRWRKRRREEELLERLFYERRDCG